MKVNKKETTQPTCAPNPQPNFTHTAVSTFKDKSTGFWHTVEVKYDPVSLQAGEVTTKDTHAQDRSSAIEAFKMSAVENVECYQD